MNKLQIASLYKNIGLNTSSEVIERQLNAATAIFPIMTLSNAEDLVLVLLCNNTDPKTIEWLIDASQSENPGLGSNGIDRDVEILCAILLRQALSDSAEYSNLICLTVEAAAFGGKRVAKIDAELPSYAREKILSYQLGNEAILPLNEEDQSDFEELLDNVEEPITANTLPPLWAPLKSIFEDVRYSTNTAFHSHASKINEIIDTVNSIDEQIQTQWFAIAKCIGLYTSHAASSRSALIVSAATRTS